MLKWFNKKKKDNKGFTLVELVVVVAILAILVGLLAPQYTKYVERSRKSADASNLENMVRAVEIQSADPIEPIPSGDYKIIISTDKAVDVSPATASVSETEEEKPADSAGVVAVKKAITDTVGANSLETRLKSSAWEGKNIWAQIHIDADNSVSVTYGPSELLIYIGKNTSTGSGGTTGGGTTGGK